MDIVIYQGPLNDDYIEMNGSNPLDGVNLVYYIYSNEWSDVGHGQTFESVDDAMEWYKSEFHDRLESEAKYHEQSIDEYVDDIIDAYNVMME